MSQQRIAWAFILLAGLFGLACIHAWAQVSTNTGVSYSNPVIPAIKTPPILCNTTIPAALLLLGSCNTATASCPGATTAMSPVASPANYPGDGTTWSAWVSSANVVSVKVCGLLTVTPPTSNYLIWIPPLS